MRIWSAGVDYGLKRWARAGHWDWDWDCTGQDRTGQDRIGRFIAELTELYDNN